MTSVKDIVNAMGIVKESGIELVKKAYAFSENAHKNHKRYSGEPYFIHPSAVAKLLAEYGADETVVAAGLLHDTVEDVGVSPETIEKEFGADVRFLVEGVTKLGHHRYHGTERHAESLRRLLVATSADVRVLFIKLMDRYHNMKTLEHVPEEKRRRIALETVEIYAPIADRLGMGFLKQEFEDLAFPYLDRDAYNHVVTILAKKRKENEEGLKKVQKEIQKHLAGASITDFKTEIRIKGLYSLYKKLERKKKDITKIYDIAALRIVLRKESDCYTALGVVHSLFRPIPGEIKDYISFPKPNGYQSIHTAVLTPDAGVVEVQIRTREMHHHAQFGIASHMSYKELGDQSRGVFEALSHTWMRELIPSLLAMGKKKETAASNGHDLPTPQWLKDLAEGHAAYEPGDEFLEGLKEDFFSHRVFVFTPKGDVIDLPVGSSTIDFAYAIHSDIGNRMAGAKVNGKLVALSTELQNGDVVEIITKRHEAATPKWLPYAKTTLARRQIRSSIEKQEKAKRG
jgi:(p)ppGpp synthase/HD superfamily hydrolase